MKRVVALASCVALFGAAAARASDPVGVYGVIERVVFEPDPQKPERIQLWGWFELSNPATRLYEKPKRGCLYYSLSETKQEACRAEWKDLAKSAGSGQCVAFGQRRADLGKVLKSDDELKNPVPYPLNSGLFALRDDTDYEPVAALVEIPLVNAPADGDLVPPGKIEIKIRNVRGKRHEQAKYRFEIAETGGGAREVSESIAPGEEQTSWSPKLILKAGADYVWRVRAVDGDWKSAQVESAIKVKGKKPAI